MTSLLALHVIRTILDFAWKYETQTKSFCKTWWQRSHMETRRFWKKAGRSRKWEEVKENYWKTLGKKEKKHVLSTRNFKKQSPMPVWNWKHQWPPQWCASSARTTKFRDTWWIQWNHIKTCMYFGFLWIFHYEHGRIFTFIIKVISREQGKMCSNIIISFTNLFLCFRTWRIPAAKAEVDKEWKIGKDSGVEPDESQKQKRDDRWRKNERRKSSFCVLDGHLSIEKCCIGD